MFPCAVCTRSLQQIRERGYHGPKHRGFPLHRMLNLFPSLFPSLLCSLPGEHPKYAVRGTLYAQLHLILGVLRASGTLECVNAQPLIALNPAWEQGCRIDILPVIIFSRGGARGPFRPSYVMDGG
eukprot:scaffold191648_cov21-Tisochrysis_lutea.AAC.1